VSWVEIIFGYFYFSLVCSSLFQINAESKEKEKRWNLKLQNRSSFDPLGGIRWFHYSSFWKMRKFHKKFYF